MPGSYAPFTRERLEDEQVGWLRALPAELRLGDLLVLHAAPGDLWRAPMPDAPDEELERVYGGQGAAVIAYGHIHRHHIHRLGDRPTVANCGSVGLPWDGDPRASYLLVEDGEPQVIRVPYDVNRDAALLRKSGHPDAERLAEMRRRGRFIPPGRAHAR